MRISDWSSDVCSSDLPLRPHQLAVAVDDDVTVDAGDVGDFLAIEEAVVLVAKVARLAAEGDLLGEARAQRIGARDDDPVLDAQFQKGVAAGADLSAEILVRNGDLDILVAALREAEHTSHLPPLMRIYYAVFCLNKKNNTHTYNPPPT